MIVKDQYTKNLTVIFVKKRKKSSKEGVKVLEEIAQIQKLIFSELYRHQIKH